jgi:hypothetical protein
MTFMQMRVVRKSVEVQALLPRKTDFMICNTACNDIQLRSPNSEYTPKGTRRRCRWGFVVTMLVPAVGAIIWFGLIPVGDPREKQDGNSALWTFAVHPLMMTFLSYLLVSLFHTALDSNRPSRPILTYFHILVINYIFQVRSRCGGCAVPVRLY